MAGLDNLHGKKAAPFVKGGGRAKSHPRDAKGRKRAKAVLAKAKAYRSASLSNASTGAEIDLDWAAWNANRKKSGISRGEVKSFKGMVGAPGKGAGIGKATTAALQARASKPGHYRAKAILAASQGNVAAAKKFQALHVARQSSRHTARMSKPAAARPVHTPTPAVNSAPKPPVTKKPKVAGKKAPRFNAQRVGMANKRHAMRSLSTPTEQEKALIDLAFRFRHGWIPIHPGEEEGHLDKAGEGHEVKITHKDGSEALYRRTSKHNKGGLAKYENVSGSAQSLTTGEMAAHLRKVHAKGGKVAHRHGGADLSKPTEQEKALIDLAFRYKHGWIKIGEAVKAGNIDPLGHEGLGERVGKANSAVRKPGDPFHIGHGKDKAKAHVKDGLKAQVAAVNKSKASWTAGHEDGYNDAAAGKKVPTQFGGDMYSTGYQRGFTQFYDEQRAKGLHNELDKAVEAKRIAAKRARAIAKKENYTKRRGSLLGRLRSGSPLMGLYGGSGYSDNLDTRQTILKIQASRDAAKAAFG